MCFGDVFMYYAVCFQSVGDVLQERFAVEMKCNTALRLAALHMHERLDSCGHTRTSIKSITWVQQYVCYVHKPGCVPRPKRCSNTIIRRPSFVTILEVFQTVDALSKSPHVWWEQEGVWPWEFHLSNTTEQHAGEGPEESHQLPPQEDSVPARATAEGRHRLLSYDLALFYPTGWVFITLVCNDMKHLITEHFSCLTVLLFFHLHLTF